MILARSATLNNTVMARQESLILINGTIGDLSFYKTRDGYFVRRKTCLSGERVKSDPAFARTRQNATEFAVAAHAGKLLRRAFEPLMKYASDSRVTSRLAGALVKVIQADATRPAGERTVMGRNTTLLGGFNFNRHSSLDKTFRAAYTASIDRATHSFTVNIPTFDPSASVQTLPGATHLRLTACGVSADFKALAYESTIARSGEIPLDKTTSEPISLSASIPGDASHPIFLVLCLEFLQEANGNMSPLQNQAYNAMAIVKVDGTADDTIADGHAVDEKLNPNPRHAPVQHQQPDRTPVPRPSVPTPLGSPVPLRSIVAEVLKSPETLDRLISAASPSTALTPEARTALGLFKLSPPALPLATASALTHKDNPRDGPLS